MTNAVTETNVEGVGDAPAIAQAAVEPLAKLGVAAQAAAQDAATRAMMAFMGGAAPMSGAEALSPVSSELDALKKQSD